MSRPGNLLAVPHHIQKLITSPQVEVLLERGFDPLLDTTPIPHATFSNVGTNGLGEQQEVGITQQRRCVTVTVALILEAIQALRDISVHDLVNLGC